MRVLQVINDLGLAGAENLVRDLVQVFPRIGVEAAVYALSSKPAGSTELLRKQGIPVYTSGDVPHRSLAHVGMLKRHLHEHAYHVVHSHLFPSILWAPLTGFKGPLVLTEHNTSNRRRGKWPLKLMDRWLYGKMHGVVCISRPVEEALHAWMPGTRGKTVVVPNGVHLDQFGRQEALSRSALGVPRNAPLILSVSRLQPHKGFATLIEAAAGLPQVHVAIAGEGPDRPALEALVARLDLSERVHLLGLRDDVPRLMQTAGLRDDVPRLMQTADLYVQPSHMEGFGISALEAMATGKPVIASRVPGLEDVVQGPEEALFSAGNARELAAKIEAVLANPALAAALGDRNRERAQVFSIHETAKGYAALYRSLLPQ